MVEKNIYYRPFAGSKSNIGERVYIFEIFLDKYKTN